MEEKALVMENLIALTMEFDFSNEGINCGVK